MKRPSRLILPILFATGVAILLFLPRNAFAAGLDLTQFDQTCLETQLKNCKVLTSGRLNSGWGDAEGEPLFAWQTQSGFTDADGVLGGFVLFHYTDGAWSLFDSGFDGYRFEPPRLAAEETLLHIAGVTAGTGAYNADRLYVFGDTGAAAYREDWTRIDIESWRDNITPLLPEGLEIWKGVDFDFDDWFYGALNARTPLWRADDGNCCPSGGWATIHFEIEDNSLVPVSVDYLPPSEG